MHNSYPLSSSRLIIPQPQLSCIREHLIVRLSHYGPRFIGADLVVLRFYRVGGDTRIAGFLLAVATTILLLVGTGPIAYIRECLPLILSYSSSHEQFVAVPVVGALIFALGIDLVKEALWDTRHRVSRCVFHTTFYLGNHYVS